jgi:hypothetical protein
MALVTTIFSGSARHTPSAEPSLVDTVHLASIAGGSWTKGRSAMAASSARLQSGWRGGWAPLMVGNPAAAPLTPLERPGASDAHCPSNVV